ncbi:hypothetical protein ACLKA7_011190 [Drosophila subpalustris]
MSSLSFLNSPSSWDNSEQSNTESTNNSHSSNNSSNGIGRQATPPLDISGAARELNLEIEMVEGGGVASTPRVVSARNRRSNYNSQSIDLVDLSNFDVDLSSRIRAARYIAPNAVIDLCTPPRFSGLINLSETGDQSLSAARRARRRRSSQVIEVIDCTPGAGPSPPKQARDLLNVTSEDVYKCPVCLEYVRQREPCTTRCGHIFCRTCIESAVRTTHKCPLCNKKTTQRHLLRIYL